MRRAGGIAALAAGFAALVAGAAYGGRPGSTPEVNPQWSGYAVEAAHVSYSSVTGTWTEPAVRCTPGDRGALSAVWVGLGGHSAHSLEQVGTDANCDASGKPTYYAWFELLPDVAHPIEAKVFAGDTITGTVRRLESNLVEVQVRNRTRRWTFTRRITWGPSDTSSAEWVVEAPYACLRFSCRQVRLANFGSVTFRDVRAIGNGLPGSLASPAWTIVPIDLVPCIHKPGSDRAAAPAAGATPEPASIDGGTFRISWVRDPGPGSACKNRPTTIGGLPDVTGG